jgi:hypothetical protein
MRKFYRSPGPSPSAAGSEREDAFGSGRASGARLVQVLIFV